MVSYEHKVKNIYLGDDSWSPWSDTMLYLKFNNNLNDSSWKNHTVTNSWTITYSQNPSAVTLSDSYLTSSSFDNLTHDWTVNIRCKLDSWTSGNAEHLFSIGSASNNRCIFLWVATGTTSWQPQGALQYARYANDKYTAWNLVTLNKRYNIVYTYDYTNKKACAYVNWIKVLDDTFWTNYDLWNTNLYIWTNAVQPNYAQWKVHWNLSEYIIESKVWSQQEITKYFKKTRTDYGYSNKDYQEVEYIESSWTQWIDTLVTPTSNTKSQIKFRNLAKTRDVIYWMYNNNDNTDYRFFNDQTYAYFDLNSWRISKTTSGTIAVWTDYELELWNFYIKNISTWTDIASWTAVWSYTWTRTITLNNYNNSSYSKNRWYYVKIREWENQVRDMIPCYRISDWEIWMYDKINKVFYTNQWTWTFTKWPDV